MAESEDPKKSGDVEHAKIGPVDWPVPRWLVAPITVLAVLCGLGYGGWLVWQKHLRDDERRIPASDLEQLEHYRIHSAETPASVFEVFNDQHGRSAFVKYYASDGCLLAERHKPNAPTVGRFLYDVNETPVAGALHALFRQPSPWFALPAEAQNRCIEVSQHGGKYTERYENVNDCVRRVWRDYEDGCSGAALWDACQGTWGPFAWARCVH